METTSQNASTFARSSELPVSADAAYAWHAREGALERLTPPWSRARVERRQGGIERGARVELRVPVGPVRLRWVAEHGETVVGREFRDVQVRGPFRMWEHAHRFEPLGSGRCVLEDRVAYRLPGGVFGAALAGAFVRREIDRMFAYRHRTTLLDLDAHRRLSNQALRIAVSGASGFVGSQLVPFLTTGGHEVVRLVRASGAGPDENLAADEARWHPERGLIDADRLDGVDAVVHLAGANIAEKRWSRARKSQILSSRVVGTRTLSEALAGLPRPPRVLVCASAVGFYGAGHGRVVDESSGAGDGFLADVCRQWEAAAEPARAAGIRVVHLRFGVVLGAGGGALAGMLTPFRMGVGGVLGSGRQFMSWISLDDLLEIVLRVAVDDAFVGPVNAVAPHPVTNEQYTRALGRVLHRPTVLPVPAAAARLAFGEMADELLLAGSEVLPARLQEHGHRFRSETVEACLRATLGATDGVGRVAASTHAVATRAH